MNTLLVLLAVLAVLLYLLCGLLFCIAYIWNFRTDMGEARLGLMGFFWPFVLLFDLVASIAGVFGAVSKRIAVKRMTHE